MPGQRMSCIPKARVAGRSTSNTATATASSPHAGLKGILLLTVLLGMLLDEQMRMLLALVLGTRRGHCSATDRSSSKVLHRSAGTLAAASRGRETRIGAGHIVGIRKAQVQLLIAGREGNKDKF